MNTLKIAVKSMWSNKVRTGLTILSMMVGIASVILVFSAGEGINGLILGQIESFGTDIIETEVKIPSTKKGMKAETESASAIAMGIQITTLSLEDLEDIKKIKNVRDGYAGILGQEQVTYKNNRKKSLVMGTNASYIDIDKSEIAFGRFFTEQEDKSLAQVAVLGKKVADKLFENNDPIGKFINLHQSKYRVIGVMDERGAVMSMDFDDYIYVPVRTMQKKIMGIDHVLYMVHQLQDLELAEETAEEVRSILRENHNITGASIKTLDNGKQIIDTAKDDFRVVTMSEMMDTLDTITNSLTILLLTIVAISLIVGGVSIMNIMYVIVSERTSEIGLRKALGARNSHILTQFLIEAVLVTLAGGIIGTLLGIFLSWLVFILATNYGFDWRFAIPAKSYLIAFGFSLFFGLFFGTLPAQKASKLEPIEALRNE